MNLYRAPLDRVEFAADLDRLCAYDRQVLELNPRLESFVRAYVVGECYSGLPGMQRHSGRVDVRRQRRQIDEQVAEILADGLQPAITVQKLYGDPSARARQLIAVVPVEKVGAA